MSASGLNLAKFIGWLLITIPIWAALSWMLSSIMPTTGWNILDMIVYFGFGSMLFGSYLVSQERR